MSTRYRTSLSMLVVIIVLLSGLLPGTGGAGAEPPQPTPTPTRAPFAYGVSFLSPGGQVGTAYRGVPDGVSTQAIADPIELVAKALVRINDARQAAGLPSLLLSEALTEAAAAHAADQLAHGFFDHQGNDGSWPAERATRHGHPSTTLGENLAVGHVTAQAAVDAWLANDGSRHNLLDDRFTHVGLAFAHNGPWHNYWVLMLSDPPAYRPGRVLVRFQPDVAAVSVQDILTRANATLLGSVGSLDVERLSIPVGQEAAVIAALQQNPSVAFAELDSRVQVAWEPDDPNYSGKWWWEQVRAPDAWDVTTGSDAVIIAVIDTGVDLDHEDLADKIVDGYDFCNLDDDPDDDHGHGTHVAGIAAAVTNNGAGVAGLSWGARIMPLKVLDASGFGYDADVAAAIAYAADNGAKVINLSLGDPELSSTMAVATDYAHGKGVFIAAAAGNSLGNTLFYPAANEHVVGVAATTGSGTRASFSNYGSHVDVAAPGTNIYSTVIGGYGLKSGTSMATPFVSGLASLVLSMDSNLTPDEVEAIIEESADDLGDPGRDDYYGWGRIDAYQAVTTFASGHILEGSVRTLEDYGVAGVLVTISGSQIFTATTDADGHFGRADLLSGTWVLTPALSTATFDPPTRTVIVTSTNVTGVTFTAQISKTFGISGTVHTSEGNGWSGVEVVVASACLQRQTFCPHSGQLTALTDAQGYFAQTGLISDTYTLTPRAIRHTFEPPTATVVLGLGPVSPQDFVVTSFVVSGTVRDRDDQGVAGVRMSLSKAGLATTLMTTTDASGVYTFTQVVSGTWVLTPAQSTATFDPPTRTVIVTSTNVNVDTFIRNDLKIYLPGVLYKFSTVVYPDDPYFGDGTQWALHNTGQFGGTDDADIDAPEAWGLGTGDSSVIVAIVDTGVDVDHPEFSGRLTDGWDYVNNDDEPDDDSGHGTHVAGIAAAEGNNGQGIAGVAWNVRIMPLKVLDHEGSGWTSDIAEGIRYATDHGAQVINLSLGGPGDSGGTLQSAVDYAYLRGVLVVAAAGNCRTGCWIGDEYYVNPPNYPAANAHTLGVASTTDMDASSSFSNYGFYVDVAAPGSDIYSTYMGGGYGYKSGTSMATPFVAGLAGLIYASYPDYTPDQVAQAIVHNADDKGDPGRDDFYGCGRINAYNSLDNGAVDSGCSGWSGLSAESVQTQIVSTAEAEFRPGVLLVKFRGAASLAERENVLTAYGLTVLKVIEGLEIYLVAVPEGQELALAETLSADPMVAYVEPDYKIYALSW